MNAIQPPLSNDLTAFLDPPPSQSFGGRVQAFFARIRQRPIYIRNARRIPIATNVGRVAVSIITSTLFIQGAQALSRQPGEASQNNWMANAKLMKTIGTARLCVAVAMIVASYTIIEQGIEIHDEIAKGRWREGFDAVLRVFDATGVLADSTASFAIGLSMIKAVQASQVLWVTPLAMVAAGFSAAAVVLEARGWYQSDQILQMLQNTAPDADNWDAITAQDERLAKWKTEAEIQEWKDEIATHPELTQEQRDYCLALINTVKTQKDAGEIGHLDRRFRVLYEELTNGNVHGEKRDGDFFLRRHFEVINREKYSAQILHIINPSLHVDAQGRPVEDRTTILNRLDLLNQLKSRLTDKIKSHKVAIISAIIGILGLILLFTPGAPIALAMTLIGISALLGTIRFFRDYYSVRQLERWLDRVCPFDNIDRNWIIKHAPRALPQHSTPRTLVAETRLRANAVVAELPFIPPRI